MWTGPECWSATPQRPFLQVQEEAGDGEERYAAFHDTLVEFVGGRVDPAELTGVERSFVRTLAHAQRAAHQLNRRAVPRGLGRSG